MPLDTGLEGGTSRSAGAARIAFLDTLRFIAAASVVVQHSFDRGHGPATDLVALVSPGVFGVVLFFIISGFVIPLTAEKGFKLGKFAIRRIFRIYPLVLFALLAAAAAGNFADLPDFRNGESRDIGMWLANLLLVQDYFGEPAVLGVTWTLSLEFAWYGLFAVAMMCLGRRFDRWLIIVAPLGMILLTILSLLIQHRFPLGRIGMIYIAIFGCRIYRYFANEITLRRLLIDGGVFWLTTTLSNIVSFGYFRHPNITLWEAVIPWTMAPALFLAVCTVPYLRQLRLLNGGVLANLGAVSYSTYLLHPFALSLANKYASPGGAFAVGAVGTLLFSLIGYRCVELPGQAIGRRLTKSTVGTLAETVLQ
jgi:peptidoglycan/LPS O-acetylase OafA/YrhL